MAIGDVRTDAGQAFLQDETATDITGPIVGNTSVALQTTSGGTVVTNGQTPTTINVFDESIEVGSAATGTVGTGKISVGAAGTYRAMFAASWRSPGGTTDLELFLVDDISPLNRSLGMERLSTTFFDLTTIIVDFVLTNVAVLSVEITSSPSENPVYESVNFSITRIG